MGHADDGPPIGGDEGLTSTADPAITIGVVDTEGLSTPEIQQQQGEAPAVPLGAAAGATAENTIPPERQSRLAALLTHMEELQMTLWVEQQATRTTTIAP